MYAGDKTQRRSSTPAHNNLLTGVASSIDPTVTNAAPLHGAWQSARADAARRRVRRARRSNLIPRFMAVPTVARNVHAPARSTRSTSRRRMQTKVVPEWVRSLVPVVEPRLDADTAPRPAGILFADPAQIDTLEYCYLEGQQGVYIETKQGFEVDGVEIKARMDFGAAAIDYRGLQKNAGAVESCNRKKENRSCRTTFIKGKPSPSPRPTPSLPAGGGSCWQHLRRRGQQCDFGRRHWRSWWRACSISRKMPARSIPATRFTGTTSTLWPRRSIRIAVRRLPDNARSAFAVLDQASGVNAPGGLTGDATVRVRSIRLLHRPGEFVRYGPVLLQKITVVLTAAQIEAMNGAPVNILPAPAGGPGGCDRSVRRSRRSPAERSSPAAAR